MCVMKTKQIMSRSMMYGGSDALSLMSVRHFLMKILNLEKKVEKFAGTVQRDFKSREIRFKKVQNVKCFYSYGR